MSAHRTLRLASVSVPVLAAAMLAAFSPAVEAAAIRYNSWAFLYGNEPGPGDPVRFEGVTDGSFDPSGPLDLGRVVVTPPAQGTVTFDGAPFTIVFDAPDIPRRTVVEPDPVPPGTSYSDLTITEHIGTFGLLGALSGTVSSDGRSDLDLTIYDVLPLPLFGYPTDQRTIVADLPFDLADVEAPRLLRLEAGASDANRVTVQVVPEPVPAVTLLLALGGLIARRRRRATTA